MRFRKYLLWHKFWKTFHENYPTQEPSRPLLHEDSNSTDSEFFCMHAPELKFEALKKCKWKKDDYLKPSTKMAQGKYLIQEILSGICQTLKAHVVASITNFTMFMTNLPALWRINPTLKYYMYHDLNRWNWLLTTQTLFRQQGRTQIMIAK